MNSSPFFAAPPLPDDLTLISSIGMGGAGSVFLVKDAAGKSFALKVISRQWHERELSAVSALQHLPLHPALVQISRSGLLSSGQFYYTMELADNAGDEEQYLPDTLAYRIKSGKIPVAELLDIFSVLASGIALLHDNQLFHGDIKPENIIFIDGRPKLADFSLVSGELHGGTAGFVPENAQNNCDRDIYALCKTFYCAWSSLDVAQFPSIPPDADKKELFICRKIYLTGCSDNFNRRFKSIEDFSVALSLCRKDLSMPNQKRILRISAVGAAILLSLFGAVWYIFAHTASVPGGDITVSVAEKTNLQMKQPDLPQHSLVSEERQKTQDGEDKIKELLSSGERIGGFGDSSMIWTTGGKSATKGENVKWRHWSDFGKEDKSCVISGGGGGGVATSWLKTLVTGPCKISYDYNLKTCGGTFMVTCDDQELYKFSAVIAHNGWLHAEYNIPAGTHIITFTYIHPGIGFTNVLNGVQLDNFKVTSVQKEDSEAQYTLGLRYKNGNGVEKDYKKAFYWFKKSAENGNAYAQWELGYCYATGNGVAKDYKQSVRWYRKSADQGYPHGQWKMGVCYYVGYGVRRDYEQAVYWYRKAAEQDHAFSQYSLGRCYEKGTGVKKNIKQAVYWYRKAAVRYKKAGEALKKLNFSEETSTVLLAGKGAKIPASSK